MSSYPNIEGHLHKRMRLWLTGMRDHSGSCRRAPYGSAEYGAVRRCRHGKVMYCKGVGYEDLEGWRYLKWVALTPWRTPVRYRRALAALREVQS